MLPERNNDNFCYTETYTLFKLFSFIDNSERRNAIQLISVLKQWHHIIFQAGGYFQAILTMEPVYRPNLDILYDQ